jgi:hypothetical protein
MIESRHFIYVCSLPLLVIACLLLAAVPLIQGDGVVAHINIGLILGTMYGVTTIAAAWAALGPGWLGVRIPLSLAIVALLVTGLGIGTSARRDPAEFTAIMGASAGAQWLLSQMPLWGMAFYFNLRLRHYTESTGEGPRGQFGIRQLMIFTAAVGVLLGVGRILVSKVTLQFVGDRELPIFLFLVGAAVTMTLPLVFAAFVSRHGFVATMACLGFILLVTLVEWPLVTTAFGNRGGPDLGHLLCINGFTTLWVLAFVGMARLCGYHFR